MRHAAVIPVLALAGCGSTAPPSASSTPGTVANPSTPEPAAVCMSHTCSLPFTLVGSADQVSHTSADFRSGSTEFGFDSGPAAWPAVTVEHALPPFADVAGKEILPQGTRYLRMTLSGVVGGMDTSSWVSNDDTFIRSVHGLGGQDESPWLVGVRDDACIRVIPRAAPARLLVEFLPRDGT